MIYENGKSQGGLSAEQVESLIKKSNAELLQAILSGIANGSKQSPDMSKATIGNLARDLAARQAARQESVAPMGKTDRIEADEAADKNTVEFLKRQLGD